MCLKRICMLPELCMCVYVPTQVEVSNANDEDAGAISQIAPILQEVDKDAAVVAVVAVDQSVPAPSVSANSDIESPSKRQKLASPSADLAPAPANVKMYRAMYYKQGLYLKSCAYICFKT